MIQVIHKVKIVGSYRRLCIRSGSFDILFLKNTRKCKTTIVQVSKGIFPRYITDRGMDEKGKRTPYLVNGLTQGFFSSSSYPLIFKQIFYVLNSVQSSLHSRFRFVCILYIPTPESTPPPSCTLCTPSPPPCTACITTA
jgi:hypothetical protein